MSKTTARRQIFEVQQHRSWTGRFRLVGARIFEMRVMLRSACRKTVGEGPIIFASVGCAKCAAIFCFFIASGVDTDSPRAKNPPAPLKSLPDEGLSTGELRLQTAGVDEHSRSER